MTIASTEKGVLVWWTSGEDCERINTLLRSDLPLPAWPDYLAKQFVRRDHASGPEPVLAAPEFGEFSFTWVVGSPVHMMTMGAKGVLIYAEDMPLVVVFPGFFTDLHMNFVSHMPEKPVRSVRKVAA